MLKIGSKTNKKTPGLVPGGSEGVRLHYRGRQRSGKAAFRLFCLIAFYGVTAGVFAGGGPENLLLVVNQNSESSQTIANHYIRWRGIPAAHVLYIDWKGNTENCTGHQFRRDLLRPILKAIEQRRLGLQIDYIIYSSDFPWFVDLRPDFPGAKIPKQMRPVASLTGATYYWQFVKLKHPGFAALDSNWYMPRGVGNNISKCQVLGSVNSRALRFSYVWKKTGVRTTDLAKGQRYLLSTMLGVTSGRGNSVAEVLSYLRRATLADATRPKGTFYFMKNSGVRSTTRDACFAGAVDRLKARGVKAEVLSGKLPKNRTDVLGITTGTSSFDIDRSHCALLPGAVCDNLTSLGGVLRSNSSQTPLTDFLRHGAAGASGTVIEPYAIQAKFPLASLPIHYVEGCSLAEAFYQSVSSPFQLLIVGDPLCQPWASPPVVELDGLEPGAIVKGTFPLKPFARLPANRKLRFLEIHLDGALQARFRPGKTWEFDSSKHADGYHLLTVVGVNADQVESQGRLSIPFQVRNHEANLEFTISPREHLTSESRLRLAVKLSGAQSETKSIDLLHNRRQIGQVQGSSGDITISAKTLGKGPVAIYAKSRGDNPVVSAPIWLQIE